MKPSRPVLNRNHELSQGLIAAFPFGSMGMGGALSPTVDLIGDISLTPFPQTAAGDGIAAGPGGMGYQNNGIAGKGLQAASAAILTPTAAITVAAMVTFRTNLTASKIIAGKTLDGVANPNWALSITTNNQIGFRVTTTVGNSVAFITSAIATVSEDPQVLIGTFDGANVRFYLNGIASAAVANAGTLLTNGVFAVGGRYDAAGVPDLPMNGDIYDLRIWDRALNDLEVRQLSDEYWDQYVEPQAINMLVPYWHAICNATVGATKTTFATSESSASAIVQATSDTQASETTSSSTGQAIVQAASAITIHSVQSASTASAIVQSDIASALVNVAFAVNVDVDVLATSAVQTSDITSASVARVEVRANIVRPISEATSSVSVSITTHATINAQTKDPFLTTDIDPWVQAMSNTSIKKPETAFDIDNIVSGTSHRSLQLISSVSTGEAIVSTDADLYMDQFESQVLAKVPVEVYVAAVAQEVTSASNMSVLTQATISHELLPIEQSTSASALVQSSLALSIENVTSDSTGAAIVQGDTDAEISNATSSSSASAIVQASISGLISEVVSSVSSSAIVNQTGTINKDIEVTSESDSSVIVSSDVDANLQNTTCDVVSQEIVSASVGVSMAEVVSESDVDVITHANTSAITSELTVSADASGPTVANVSAVFSEVVSASSASVTVQSSVNKSLTEVASLSFAEAIVQAVSARLLSEITSSSSASLPVQASLAYSVGEISSASDGQAIVTVSTAMQANEVTSDSDASAIVQSSMDLTTQKVAQDISASAWVQSESHTTIENIECSAVSLSEDSSIITALLQEVSSDVSAQAIVNQLSSDVSVKNIEFSFVGGPEVHAEVAHTIEAILQSSNGQAWVTVNTNMTPAEVVSDSTGTVDVNQLSADVSVGEITVAAIGRSGTATEQFDCIVSEVVSESSVSTTTHCAIDAILAEVLCDANVSLPVQATSHASISNLVSEVIAQAIVGVNQGPTLNEIYSNVNAQVIVNQLTCDAAVDKLLFECDIEGAIVTANLNYTLNNVEFDVDVDVSSQANVSAIIDKPTTYSYCEVYVTAEMFKPLPIDVVVSGSIGSIVSATLNKTLKRVTSNADTSHEVNSSTNAILKRVTISTDIDVHVNSTIAATIDNILSSITGDTAVYSSITGATKDPLVGGSIGPVVQGTSHRHIHGLQYTVVGSAVVGSAAVCTMPKPEFYCSAIGPATANVAAALNRITSLSSGTVRVSSSSQMIVNDIASESAARVIASASLNPSLKKVEQQSSVDIDAQSSVVVSIKKITAEVNAFSENFAFITCTIENILCESEGFVGNNVWADIPKPVATADCSVDVVADSHQSIEKIYAIAFWESEIQSDVVAETRPIEFSAVIANPWDVSISLTLPKPVSEALASILSTANADIVILNVRSKSTAMTLIGPNIPVITPGGGGQGSQSVMTETVFGQSSLANPNFISTM
jgi:hypothetical protein